MGNILSEQSLLKRISNNLTSAAGITIIFCIALAIFATIDKGFYILINTIVTGGMWALMAMGLALIFGVMNIVCFVHGEFFMIGALTSYFVFTPINNYLLDHPKTVLVATAPLVAILTAIISGILVGILCEFMVFRPLRKRSREQWVMNSFVITLGMSVFAINTIQITFGADFRGIVNYWPYPPLSFLGVFISFDRLAAFIIALIVIVGLLLFIKFSKFGQAIRAVSQDETGSHMVGININAIQTLTLALSCALAALAGACLLFMYPSYPTMGLGPLYNSWFIVILAGMGNVGGAAVGAFIIALFQVLTTVYIGEGWDYTVPAAIIVIILVFRPSGIFGSEVRGILNQ